MTEEVLDALVEEFDSVPGPEDRVPEDWESYLNG